MQKIHLIVLLALLVTGFIFVSSSKRFEASHNPLERERLSVSLPTPSFNFLDNLNLSLNSRAQTREQAWQTFQDYLKALEEKDFESFSRLSHQISSTCLNLELRTACEELMDTVHEFGQTLSQEEFRNIAFDEKQVILYTDYLLLGDGWFERKAIYFTNNGTQLKILGIKACYTEDTSLSDECVNLNPETRDQNQNGWWDLVEGLFY